MKEKNEREKEREREGQKQVANFEWASLENLEKTEYSKQFNLGSNIIFHSLCCC